jgi:hypothetical protein
VFVIWFIEEAARVLCDAPLLPPLLTSIRGGEMWVLRTSWMDGNSLVSSNSGIETVANRFTLRYDGVSWLSLGLLFRLWSGCRTFEVTSRSLDVLSEFALRSGSASYSSSSPLSLLGSTKCTTPLFISYSSWVGHGAYAHDRGISTHRCPTWNSSDCSADPMSSPALNLTAVTGRKRNALPRIHGFLRSVQYLHFSESRNLTPRSVYIKPSNVIG